MSHNRVDLVSQEASTNALARALHRSFGYGCATAVQNWPPGALPSRTWRLHPDRSQSFFRWHFRPRRSEGTCQRRSR
eukprot:1051207-Pyramimonas_sp.AAC.1